MVSQDEVQLFLQDFLQKIKMWDIRFRNDRMKNSQALLDLEITPPQRVKLIEDLKVSDYSKGPDVDTLNAGAPLWVFGKLCKGKMIYIKISIGPVNRPVICISFHKAEREMKFPFKD